MAAIPHNNAFGALSPSWNLPFPEGNITAAEILAYLPHWLKSIDVIDRFVSHGARSANVAAIINEFRDLPTDSGFKPNSAMIMMQTAMRYAGYEEWTVGTHGDFPRQIARPEDDLDVKGFRSPRLSHPKAVRAKSPEKVAVNMEAEPIDFKHLALYVKQHPSGPDALDLTRCVQYALEHEDEEWLFPTDFRRLTTHLGGPATVTRAHFDRQIFARRNDYQFSPAKSTPGKGRTPIKRGTPGRTPTKVKTQTPRSIMKTRVSDIMEETLSGRTTPQKRLTDRLGRIEEGSKRRSGRLVGKKINFGEDSEVDGSDFGSLYNTPKKRKLSCIPPTPKTGSNDSDFEGESEPDDDDTVKEEEDAYGEELVTPTRGRKAARKARTKIQQSFVPTTGTPLKLKIPKIGPSPEKVTPKPAYMTQNYDPDVMAAAASFHARTPTFHQPPVLSANRLRIDNMSIYLYSLPPHINLADMYASAYSFSRFGGPRRSAPFRELHLLGDPDPRDVSDWAENVRWAKEQNQIFGSVWTEYEYYLVCISEIRRVTGWVSEEAIRAGMMD